MRLFAQLGQQQQIVFTEAIAFLPLLILLVNAAGRHRVPRAIFAFVLPDGYGEAAVTDFMGGLSFVVPGESPCI